MRTLSIEAASRESASGLCSALSSFHAVAIEQPDSATFIVRVDLSGGSAEIIAILNAIQQHVMERRAGPAVIGLDGHTYTMETP